jgi:hypothetical protein
VSREVSLQELASLFKGEEMVRPRITEAARKCLGKTAEVVDHIGLPTRVADSFKAASEISCFSIPQGCGFHLKQERVPIHRAVEIGRAELGSYVIDCDLGYIIYIDFTGTAQLILFWKGFCFSWVASNNQLSADSATLVNCWQIVEKLTK